MSLVFGFALSADASSLTGGWTNARALGMGNAYTAVVDDADSLFYNPAGLARVNGFNLNVFDVRAGLNGLESIENAMKLKDIQDDIAGTINDLYGKRTWVGGGGKAAFAMPYFGVAGFANSDAGFYIQNPANTTMNLNYYFDYGIAIGGAMDLVPGIWKVGLTAKRIDRTGTTMPIGPSTLATLDPEALKEELRRRGTGYGLDFGTVFTFPGPISPAISFVYRNVGGTSFTHDEGAGAPPGIPPEMIVGAALKIDAALITVTPSVDFTHLDRSDLQMGMKVHAGVEVDLPLIALRAGINQGYYTAGVGVDLALLSVDVATYGVELGAYPGQHEDRRYVAQIKFDLGFDPFKFSFGGGNGSGKSGGRSKLKRRR